jgi:archaemetzincin
MLEDVVKDGRIHVLGVADVDLYSAIFTFVFGESRLGGNVAMMSLQRLRPELYGLPEDAQLLQERAQREALHEVGHLLGLVHCKHPDCVMRFSGSVEEVDLKSSRFCPACEAHRKQLRTTPDD